MKAQFLPFDRVSSIVSKAAKETISAFNDRDLPGEEEITTSLVTRIHIGIDGHYINGVHWSAKILSHQGAGSEEKLFGADFLGVVRLNIMDYHVEKGFLVQAKRQEPGKELSLSEWVRLREQCDKMLFISPHSYVFVYSHIGIIAVPASTIFACHNIQDLYKLPQIRIGQFYKRHFYCQIGDRKLSAELLSKIKEERLSTSGLLLQGQKG